MPRRNGLSQKQRDFYYHFTNPTSPTYDNATQSAIKAGYKPSYAKAEVYKKLVPIIKEYNRKQVEQEDDAQARRIRILNQSEKNIEEYVHMTSDDAVDRKIKADMTRFAAERLGKDYYSTRTETVNSVGEVLSGDVKEVLEVTLKRYLTTNNTPQIDQSRIIDV